MREFDADGLLVCRYQASIFERSLIKRNADPRYLLVGS